MHAWNGDAPEGFSTYFAGAEVESDTEDFRFASWQLSVREYIVCKFEAGDFKQLSASLGKMMKFPRFWLKKHGLIADSFFRRFIIRIRTRWRIWKCGYHSKKEKNNILGGNENE